MLKMKPGMMQVARRASRDGGRIQDYIEKEGKYCGVFVPYEDGRARERAVSN
jgi:hypothetical protein